MTEYKYSSIIILDKLRIRAIVAEYVDAYGIRSTPDSVHKVVSLTMRGANPRLLQKELDMLAWPQKYIVRSSEKNYRQSSFAKTYCFGRANRF